MKPNIKLLLLTLLVYGIPVLIWSYVPFSRNMWGSFTSSFIFNYLLYGKMTYSAMGIIFDFLLLYCIYLLLFKKEVIFEKERVYLIFSGLKKMFSYIFINNLRQAPSVSKEEKVSLLFYLVKLFWTPVMIGFLIGNTMSLTNSLNGILALGKTGAAVPVGTLTTTYFYLLFYIILVIDTLIFSFGYLVESPKLKNIVKSVEPTALGWLVAIACYPPVNDITGKLFGWYTSDFGDFGNVKLNIIMGVVSLLLFTIYVWASVALGFKASNLTNRGIVSKGPYKYVRHPAYASKNLSWWVMGIPFIINYGLIAVFGLTAWSFLYYMRALTEERHLSQDPDYVEYVKKVKYMFFPGIY
jgi:hypothetical protein